jgi:hypothetical protein
MSYSISRRALKIIYNRLAVAHQFVLTKHTTKTQTAVLYDLGNVQDATRNLNERRSYIRIRHVQLNISA